MQDRCAASGRELYQQMFLHLRKGQTRVAIEPSALTFLNLWSKSHWCWCSHYQPDCLLAKSSVHHVLQSLTTFILIEPFPILLNLGHSSIGERSLPPYIVVWIHLGTHGVFWCCIGCTNLHHSLIFLSFSGIHEV